MCGVKQVEGPINSFDVTHVIKDFPDSEPDVSKPIDPNLEFQITRWEAILSDMLGMDDKTKWDKEKVMGLIFDRVKTLTGFKGTEAKFEKAKRELSGLYKSSEEN